MSFAAGTFTLVAGNPVVTGTVVSSTWANNTLSDIASGLSTCVLKDGTQVTTAPVPFAQGITGTTFTASTSVVTPLVKASAGNGLQLGGNNVASWQIWDGATNTLVPLTDNAQDLGRADLRISTVFTPIIDSGSGSVVVKASGQTVLTGTPSGNVTLAGTLQGPATMLSPIANAMIANVTLTNSANFFDGPTIAQGTAGTWLAGGTVTLSAVANSNFRAKLWDGSTVISSTAMSGLGAGLVQCVSLFGYITNPAGNIRISVQDSVATTSAILFNSTALSKDSTISAIRIA